MHYITIKDKVGGALSVRWTEDGCQVDTAICRRDFTAEMLIVISHEFVMMHAKMGARLSARQSAVCCWA